MAKLKYAYYPGCASQEITKEANESTVKVARLLGIELHEMPGANCCGAGLLTDYDRELYLALNARIFAQAEEMGMDIMTICSTCLMVMNRANTELINDPKLLASINRILGRAGLNYSGTIKIRQLLWVLVEDYGLKRLAKKVKTPLSWLKAAPFYGCHSLRPSRALGFDDPENPTSLEAVIKALGGQAVEYEGRTRCCGFQVDLVNQDTAMTLTAKRLVSAQNQGAVCMVTPCPFCHINLDNYQELAEKHSGRKIDLPVFHLPQIVGLALGLGAGDVGLSRHLVSPEHIIG